MQNYYVIGDIHGKLEMLERLLDQWDGQSLLIFLGDLIDRGEDSYGVLKMVKGLVNNQKAICLMGNHEYMFLAWLDNPSERYDHYQINGGDTTINSILRRPLDFPVDSLNDAKKILSEYSELVSFIRELPFHFETKQMICVHAGLDLELSDWHETSDYQKVWIRQPFHEGINKTGKRIIFGHTPNYSLLKCPIGTSEIWQTDDGKLGIDGGAVYGGVLHGVLVNDDGLLEHFYVENKDKQTDE